MPDITEIFAFIAAEDDGEGVVAFNDGDAWMPLVAADCTRVNSMRKIAQQIADESGMVLTLARFTTRTDLETIAPKVRQ